MMDKAAYLDQLHALLPTGEIWQHGPGTTLDATLEMPAAELARIDARGDNLVDESDPRTTGEMFFDWERVLGLPDPCTGQLPTLELRRARIIQKLTSVGGQSRAYFIGLAESLGYENPWVTEFRPFTTGSSADDFLYTDPWRHVWRLNLWEETLEHVFTAQSGCDEFLRWWGDPILECLINQLKPAHTHVLYGYGYGSEEE